MRAAYTLGVGVGGAAAAAALLPPLRELPAEAAMGEEEEKEELSSKFDESDPVRPSAANLVPLPWCRRPRRGAGRGQVCQAMYGLVELGAAAVPSLLALAEDPTPPPCPRLRRARRHGPAGQYAVPRHRRASPGPCALHGIALRCVARLCTALHGAARRGVARHSIA